MKFSVVMPCYNAAHYLAEAIESIIQQSYTDWELIIVDDGSIDTSLQIARDYQASDQRIRVIQQPNSGKPAIARNVGITLVTGDILCFLDADDRYEKNRFDTLKSCFQQDPKADYLFHNYRLIDEQGKRTQPDALQQKVQPLLKRTEPSSSYMSVGSLYNYFLFNGCLIHTSTIAIRLDRFEQDKLLFREDLTCAEDLMFWFYLAGTAYGGFIAQTLSDYRDTPFSISKNQALLDQETARFYKMQLSYPPTELDTEAKVQIKKLISENLLSAAYHYSLSRQKTHAFSLAFKAFLIQPSIHSMFETGKVLLRRAKKGTTAR